MLLDTSGLLCLLYKSEPLHAEAERLYDAAPARILHSYIVAELTALTKARSLHRLRMLNFVADLPLEPEIETVWVDPALHREGVDLLLKRADKSYSLCDAVSFILMRQRGLREALTTDHHFEQEGFVRLLV